MSQVCLSVPECSKPVLDGNTSKDPSKTGAQSPCKYWVFTLFNFCVPEVDALNKFFENKCISGIGGLEICPTTKKEHIQGWFALKNKERMTGLLKILPKGIHLEKAKAGAKANDKYCTKDGNILAIWPPLPDCINIKDMDQWQKDIIEICKNKADNRTINWYWEPDGKCGKSQLCKWLCIHMNAVLLGGSAADMKYALAQYFENHQSLPKIILIDIPRAQKIPDMAGLEEIKNGIFFSPKFKSGMVIGNSPHIFIFCNYQPERLDKWSKDRWNIVKIEKFEQPEYSINEEYDDKHRFPPGVPPSTE